MTMQHGSNPPIAQAVKLYEAKLGFKIKTDKEFYTKIAINPKRFGLLIKGRLVPTIDELKRVATIFNIPITELL
ncbi:hypothetical protein GCM10028806_34900 [Spirosoma terrae]|uniref:HTH cro/C1-type domain-containing protein n=1 Tax=Spirosoma terrae TaxID=1968276 RepID=A0A6L9LAG8_9BACT|nr:hypothetical protein [Spirosoma terrae]NDU95803.1 hypothetical protein [Spirosoma terrae]